MLPSVGNGHSIYRELLKASDGQLSQTKYVWLTRHENFNQTQLSNFEETFTLQLKTGQVWTFKEMLRDLWDQDSAKAGTIFFNEWYKRVIHNGLEQMKSVARFIKDRLVNVVSYCSHPLTHGGAEGLNSRIISIKRRVGGFRNRQNFKTTIFFRCGGLNLSPR
ncbi:MULTISPECIES: transposase [unclassified Schlesneria]|uniref:transposase n=1 Tax=unclassified Schlesneria TaxID=2762017 RepID=UPI002EF8809B